MIREKRRYLLYNSLPIIITMFVTVLFTKCLIRSNRLDLVIYLYPIVIIIANMLSINWRSRYVTVRINKSVDNIRRFKNFSGDFYIVNEGEEQIYKIKSSHSVIPVAFKLDDCNEYYELFAPRGIKSILKSYDIRDATFT